MAHRCRSGPVHPIRSKFCNRRTVALDCFAALAMAALVLESHLQLNHHRYMVGRALPAARFFQYAQAAEPRLQRTAHPDMIEPAALVRLRPIRRAIAPPGVEFFLMRDVVAHRIDPWPRV